MGPPRRRTWLQIDSIGCATCVSHAWHENRGAGQFTEHRFDDNQSAYDLRLVDMDGDGDLDIVVASFESRNGVWYENRLSRPKPR